MTLSNNWKWVKLGELCDKISLNKIKIKQKDYLDEGTYPVVDQGQDLIGGYYNDKTLVIPNEPPYVIFGDHTRIKKYITFKFIAGADGVKVLKAKDAVDSKFLYYSLFTIKIENKGYARHFQLLEKELFPLPPKPTQLAIISKIEELFSEIDKGIESLRTAQKQLNTYRQSVLKWAFEGKLTNEWRETTGVRLPSAPRIENMAAEPEAEYKMKRNHTNQKNQISYSSDKGGLPEGWKWRKLNDIGTWKGGGTPSKANKSFWEEGNILWVSPKDMKSKVIHDTIDKITSNAIENSSAKLIIKGSILFVVRSGILRRTLPVAITICNVTVNQDLQAFTPISVLPDYVYWYVQSKNEDIRRDCSKDGTTVESIESSLLKNYLIPVCSNEEQYNIVQQIESRLSIADKMEESINQSLQQAEALKQSILKKAFEGRLT